MTLLTNKRVLLGVSGGIAAYKSADLVRRLREMGAEVRVVMTADAQAFITPLSLQALSGNEVHTKLLDSEAEAGMGHIELARWSDAIIIAPATANTISRLAQGEGSDLLSTLCLARKSPLLLAPAMNQAMWANQATEENVCILRRRGVHIVGPGSGSQACGDIGEGRMLDPLKIAESVARIFSTGLLAGKKVLITAGPTREAIDPVRYISNCSSGKMGYALAQAALEAGAEVILVSGPVHIPPPERARTMTVGSAREMHRAVMDHLGQLDLFVGVAAVADYRPLEVSSGKIKKSGRTDKTLSIELVENPDIIAEVAEHPEIFCVGFAAETSNVESYAREKLIKKNLQMVVANDVSRSHLGFDSDDNAVTVVEKSGNSFFEEASKSQLARDLIQLIAQRLENRKD